MLNNLFVGQRNHGLNETTETRRRYPRRHADHCVLSIDGTVFPITDWSFGGLKFIADDRMFSTDQQVDMVIKFKLRSAIIDVPVRGTVVRKTNGHLSVEFEALSHTMRRAFQQVIDDRVAGDFADSQAV